MAITVRERINEMAIDLSNHLSLGGFDTPRINTYDVNFLDLIKDNPKLLFLYSAAVMSYTTAVGIEGDIDLDKEIDD